MFQRLFCALSAIHNKYFLQLDCGERLHLSILPKLKMSTVFLWTLHEIVRIFKKIRREIPVLFVMRELRGRILKFPFELHNFMYMF